MATFLPTHEVLNVQVSCFANYNTPSNPKPINLYAWLTNTKYQAKVDTIRQTTDKAKRDELKATLPAITPSGQFSYRQAASLLPDGHSRLIQFDIDFADNKQIRNYANLKEQLIKLRFVAYCGLSVSGMGYWGLVPIAYPERHSQHFDALRRVFAHYGIKLDDKPRNIASLRGYSFDADGYFSSEVMLFDLYDEPQPPPSRSYDASHFDDEDDAKLLTRIVRMVEDAGEGNRHGTLLKAARLAGGYIAAGRIDEDTIVCALETVVGYWPNFTKSQKTIRDGIKYGATAPIYSQEWTAPLSVNYKPNHQPIHVPPLAPETTPNTPQSDSGERIANSVDQVALTPAPPTESGCHTPVRQLEELPKPNEPTFPTTLGKVEPASFRLPRLIEQYWDQFVRPPFWYNKIRAHRALLRFLSPDEPREIVHSVQGQYDNPGSILKPLESQLEREPEQPCDTSPPGWDKPTPPDAVPQIKPLTFYEWTKQDKYFSQLGLNSLTNSHETIY